MKNEQNEHISMKSRKLKNYQILANFPKRAFYCLVYLYQKLWILRKMTNFNDSTKMNIFQRNNRFYANSLK